jgi:hypothetical protein
MDFVLVVGVSFKTDLQNLIADNIVQPNGFHKRIVDWQCQLDCSLHRNR